MYTHKKYWKEKIKASLLFSITIGITFIAYITQSCYSSTDFDKGKELLIGMGYSKILNTGHSWFCCSEEDNYSTGFEATDKNGNKIEGCFCSSIGKKVTIRFE